MEQSEVSSPSTNPSNQPGAGIVLAERGFRFRRNTLRLQENSARTFHQTWLEFLALVLRLNGFNVVPEDVFSSNAAIIAFLEVMTAAFLEETDFMHSLLLTLGEVLGSTCVREGQWLKLSNCENVRFAESVNRQTCLKFVENVGISKDSTTDIACVFVRDDVIDTTAVVELKLNDSSCDDYDLNDTKEPDLTKKAYHPLAQALFYTLDTFHCLSRRGVRPLQDGILPVVVLAAKRPSPKKDSHSNKLCCMKGSLRIPNNLGEEFCYSIDECIKFPSDNESTDKYVRAIIVLIDTLSIGLKYAEYMKCNTTADPRSLCSLVTLPELTMLACPIPRANRIQGHPMISADVIM
jgi:hypothetical protein